MPTKSTTATTKTPRKRAAAATTAPAPSKTTTDRVTFKDAAEKVLRDAAGPMKVKAIAELAIPLVTPAPTGKTPAATLGAHLVVDANKGGRFIKTAPGTFDVRELNPRGAAKRPAAKPASRKQPTMSTADADALLLGADAPAPTGAAA